MSDVSGRVADRVAAVLGSGVVSARVLSGGCIGDVRLAELDDGRRVVVKTGRGAFEAEAWMLRYLGARSPVRVPEVLHAEESLLLMEFIEHDGRRDDAGQRAFGRLLAEQHGVVGARFGLERATSLGPIRLDNTPDDDWRRFFVERRLIPMADRAGMAGSLPDGVRRRIDRLSERIDEMLGEHDPAASLVHGDLWAGNMLWGPPGGGGSIAAIIDPAVHYADAETELAFIDLMGGLGPAFWEGYEELRPVPESFWARRRDLYNLIPLLVHAALFDAGSGGGYGSSVASSLARLGF